MAAFVERIVTFVDATKIPEQLREVDAAGLFTNWHFLVPFLCFMAYLLYRQAFTKMTLIGIAIGLWVFSGSSFMKGLVVNGELQLSKILPVAGVWVLAVGTAVYLLFMRSE
ncbi:MAG: hypothetical protein P8130_06985 [Deltaproteobacteria bacterium]